MAKLLLSFIFVLFSTTNTSERPFIIGIAGGTASGKTTLAHKVCSKLGEEHVTLVSIDYYYRDLSHMPLEERRKSNFDDPQQVELSLLTEHIAQLQQGLPIEQPRYSFTTSTRDSNTVTVHPRKYIVIEGIFALCSPSLRKLYDISFFLTADADIRFIRRFMRDITERQLPQDYVIKQYLETVRPSHNQFIEPTKDNADFVFSGEDDLDELTERVMRKISACAAAK